MADESDDKLDQFLKFLDLEDCKPDFEKIGVFKFEDLENVNVRALKRILPDPAVQRVLAYHKKFSSLLLQKNNYPSLKNFLEKLDLADIQTELEVELRISRVEHLKFTTKESLRSVVGEENAKQILKAFKDLKRNPVKEWGTKLWEMISKSRFSPLKRNNPPAGDISPITRVTNAPPKPVEPTEQVAAFGQITSVLLSRINYENYQQVYTPDDEIPYTPSAPDEAEISDSSSTSSEVIQPSEDWIRFPRREIEELKSSGRESPISQVDWVLVADYNESEGDSKNSSENEQDRSCLPKPLNTSDGGEPKATDPKCSDAECSDFYVLDYFRSAREEDSWQYYDDVQIELCHINSVRYRLGHLGELPDDDISNALRFVHSEQHNSHIFFDRPPPTCGKPSFVEWHYIYAARVLILRHLYAIATHMNFYQCLEALSSCNWDFNAALTKILL